MKNRAGAGILTPVLATSLVALLVPVRLEAAMQDPAAIEAPTPAEQAIIEQRCSATRATSAPDGDAYHTCLMTELAGIRADFGRDLLKLSPAERRYDGRCLQQGSDARGPRCVRLVPERPAGGVARAPQSGSGLAGGSIAAATAGPERAGPGGGGGTRSVGSSNDFLGRRGRDDVVAFRSVTYC